MIIGIITTGIIALAIIVWLALVALQASAESNMMRKIANRLRYAQAMRDGGKPVPSQPDPADWWK